MQTGYLKAFDNRKIWIYVWDKVQDPKGIVQIFHGMAEHAGRYENFAKFLNTKGYIVVASDHRAFGRTAPDVKEIGTYDGSNIFFDSMHDQMFIGKQLKEEYNLPIFVFAHSYGSFLAQGFMELIGQFYSGAIAKFYSGVVLCGSAFMKNRADIFFGKRVAKITMKHKGPDAPANLIAKMSFGKYDKKVKTGSWLNTDETEVKKYYADPYCGATCSAKFYYNLFKSFDRLYSRKNYKRIPKDLPIFLISGKCDPVGDMGKSVIKLYKFYLHIDCNVKMKLYDKARHEILNEPIKQTVYEDVLDFFDEHNPNKILDNFIENN